MKENDFNKRLSIIENKIELSASSRNTYIEKINDLKKNLDSLIVNLDDRDSKFISYLKDISNLSFADKLMTPSDIFQGIRTASESADYEELEKTGERMKSNALDITNNNEIAETACRTSFNDLQSAKVALIQYITLKNEAYDLELGLLKDLQSIYDVGNLSNEEATQWIAKNS